ncbi:hypothetical protein BT63DRAFT_101021 [Microthyrium microscopicum]|uniref:alpha-galactosidase n=1 Tax=Microthyrium microscopicum TaxID=703497 RepID=A0A6A6TVJ8_9PEZI|nr:hypothetical protein BT63DRAFT_101021 [Microthyrium microscopicum]
MRSLLFLQACLAAVGVSASNVDLEENIYDAQAYKPRQLMTRQIRPAAPVSGPRIGGPVWKPQIGQKVQVILDRRVAQLTQFSRVTPEQADIWDLDLFDTTKQTIDVLHANGKRVICYLSVGGSESWRPDFLTIPKSDLGDVMPKWKGERYLNLRSPTVWRLMQDRIKMAYDKGCDGIDPDNVDPFNDDFERGGGFTPPLTEADSVDYLRNLSAEAHYYGMAVGMKNAESILANVTDFIEFAVNEECATYSTDEDGCMLYVPFLAKGKPVFHFEYVNVNSPSLFSRGAPSIQSVYKNWANLSSADILSYYCLQNNFGFPYLPNSTVGAMFSTAVKKLDLGGWVMYCDGTYAETPTAQTVGGPDRELDPGWRGKESQRGGKGKSGGLEMTSPTGPQAGGSPSGGLLGWLTGGGRDS